MLSQRLATQLARAERLILSARDRLSPDRRRQRAGFIVLRERFYDQFWRTAAAAVGADIDALGHGFYRMRRAGRWTITRQSDVMLDDHLSLDLAGDKPVVNRLLAEQGFPAVRHLEFTLAELDAAERFLAELGGRPAVVKPAFGTGAGRGVVMGITSPQHLAIAARRAAAFRSRLLIEEQHNGRNYRLLYLRGQLIDAIRRDPPSLIGDGHSSLRALIEAENAARLSAKPIISLHPISIDAECGNCLRAQGRSLRDVPADGEEVIVKNVINQNAARNNHRVLAQVDPAVVQLGAAVVDSVGLQLVGLDLIAARIDQPLGRGDVINELNTSPGLHHHVLVAEGEADAPVGQLLGEELLSGPGARTEPRLTDPCN